MQHEPRNVDVECNGDTHRLSITCAGERTVVSAPDHDHEADAVLAALRGDESPPFMCGSIVEEWQGAPALPTKLVARAIERRATPAAAVSALDAQRAVAGLARVDGFGEERIGQQRVAVELSLALGSDRRVLVEAPSGTGKTHAILAAVAAVGRPAVIAVPTTELCDALVGSDIAALGLGAAPPAALKGRSQYLCRAQVAELVRTGTGADPDLARIVAWAGTTRSGDRSELGTIAEATWRAVSVGADECPGAATCPFGSTCFVQRAIDRAQAADIVVTTHAKLLWDRHLRTVSNGRVQLIPGDRVVVVDEGHLLSDAAIEFGRRRLSPVALRRLATTIERVLREHDVAWLDAAPHPHDLRAVADRLDVELAAGAAGGQVTKQVTGLVCEVHDVVARWAVALDLADVLDHDPAGRAALQRLAKRASTLGETAERLLRPAKGAVALATDDAVEVVPLDGGPILRRLLADTPALVFTSATLGRIGGEARARARLGVAPDVPHVAVKGPFDRDQLWLYCPRLPRWGDPAAQDEIDRERRQLVEAAGGRALLLFTSWAELRRVHQTLGPPLEAVGIRCLAQGEGDPDRLAARFREDETSVLFGTRTFFTGVDLAGPTCSLVVLDRLPFRAPQRPDVLARAMHAAGQDRFVEDQLLPAATDLTQIAGRLIRRRTDRGVLAVLDSRLGTARYAQTLRDAVSVTITHDRQTVLRHLHNITHLEERP